MHVVPGKPFPLFRDMLLGSAYPDGWPEPDGCIVQGPRRKASLFGTMPESRVLPYEPSPKA